MVIGVNTHGLPTCVPTAYVPSSYLGKSKNCLCVTAGKSPQVLCGQDVNISGVFPDAGGVFSPFIGISSTLLSPAGVARHLHLAWGFGPRQCVCNGAVSLIGYSRWTSFPSFTLYLGLPLGREVWAAAAPIVRTGTRVYPPKKDHKIHPYDVCDGEGRREGFLPRRL